MKKLQKKRMRAAKRDLIKQCGDSRNFAVYEEFAQQKPIFFPSTCTYPGPGPLCSSHFIAE